MFLFSVSEKRMMVEAIADSPASVVVILITFFSCWSVFGLAGFHTYLAASNQTTNEDVGSTFDRLVVVIFSDETNLIFIRYVFLSD